MKDVKDDIIKDLEEKLVMAEDVKRSEVAYNKTFKFKIRASTNCIVDEDDINSVKECAVKIKPSFDKYDITLFGAHTDTALTQNVPGPKKVAIFVLAQSGAVAKVLQAPLTVATIKGGAPTTLLVESIVFFHPSAASTYTKVTD